MLYHAGAQMVQNNKCFVVLLLPSKRVRLKQKDTNTENLSSSAVEFQYAGKV